MKHEGDEEPETDELFARLEAEMKKPSDTSAEGEVLNFDKARAARATGAVHGTADDPSWGGETGARPTIVDDPAPVDSGPGLIDRIKNSKRLDIIPAWARSAREFKEAMGWLAGHAGHTVAFHAVRVPFLYVPKLVWRAPRGLLNTLGRLGRWARDAEGDPLRQAEARRENTELYLKLSRQRDRRVRLRTLLVLLGLPITVAAVLYLIFGASFTTRLAVGVLAVCWLGWKGAPADAPLATRAVIKAEVQRLTSDIVVRAMASIGISQITSAVAKGEDGITFVAPITREGPGWRADIDLPLGVTVADVADRRSRLASGLRRPLGCVWPEADPSIHEGRLVLWVGDRDLSKTGFVKWQLANAKRHDIFKGNPFGIDPRGRGQVVPLIQHNVLIGSLPGQGKTASVRVIACGAALDPTVELWLHENKGTGDLDALKCVSHRFVSGIDDESIRYAADSLKLLREEVMRRAAAMKKLPRDLCPDKRITREIANKRSLKLWPLLAVFDECQNLFAHPEYGKQAGEDAEFVIKLGRALGVILVLATQRPDKDSLPTGVSGNVSIRFCLRVAGQIENDMILGTSAYKNGIRATAFRPEGDAGNGYLVGATSVPTVVRTAYLDDPATEAIAQRALALRKAERRLSGIALGEESETPSGPSYDLLGDVAAVVPVSEERVWNERIAARLAELRPEVYGGWKGENVTLALKPHGIKTTGVAGVTDEGERTTRRGIVRADVSKAIAERDGSRGAA
ncbi:MULTISPECIES: cell division protein FtsK [Streptomyces]|uniref:cell division protein FtsK n=1 Tax=Streptomyces TaxID=1883 RepID=UPI001E58DCC6|nr:MULTISPECIES: cell division protein FtsK [Streptomyces]UFQ16875.1 cell division protein FtsK [Streptomyces huasconensis]WCL86478.1 cell division protein FtsK [Streptomyces sp. JCM 35825]